jgi:Predicted integral membrane protein
MKKKIRDFIFISLITIIPTLLIWLPFFAKIESFWTIPLGKDGMATIVANYDGPLYIVIAKSLYNTEIIKQITSFTLPVEYYAAHFPLFPLLIRLIAPLFGFPYAMLLTTISTSIFCIYFFYKLARTKLNESQAKWLTFIFSIFPARWLITRSIGSPEPLFVGAIIASVYYFREKKYLLSGIMGIVAQLTKSPGILLFIAYIIAIFIQESSRLTNLKQEKKINSLNLLKYLPILLIPLSLIIIFIIYGIRFNDFFAYFHSGDNIHLSFPLFKYLTILPTG